MASDQAGGFVHLAPSRLPSPPASRSSVAGSSVTSSVLPKPRRRPLKGGSVKESAFINWVDAAILKISRKFANKALDAARAEDHTLDQAGQVPPPEGYTSFKEAGKDIERVLDVVWVSGTPSLQIAYLLTLATMVVEYAQSLPSAPRATFKVLTSLDFAFASLIEGHDADSGEALPGFENGKKVNLTEKVRIRSLIEKTRNTVVAVMTGFDMNSDEIQDPDDMQSNGDDDNVYDDMELEGPYDMDVATVYARTLAILGDTLTGPPIGIGGN